MRSPQTRILLQPPTGMPAAMLAARPNQRTPSGALKHAREKRSMRQSSKAVKPVPSTPEAADDGCATPLSAASTVKANHSPLGAPPAHSPPTPPTGMASPISAPALAAAVTAAGSDPESTPELPPRVRPSSLPESREELPAEAGHRTTTTTATTSPAGGRIRLVTGVVLATGLAIGAVAVLRARRR